MTTLTTEQEIKFDFAIVDGRGRPVAIDESDGPIAVSSDESVATVSVTKVSDGKYTGEIVSVTPSPEGTTQRVTITADADIGAGVQEVVGFIDFNVTLDPRTASRVISLNVQEPTDKPV